MTVTPASLLEHADWLDAQCDRYLATVLRAYAYTLSLPEENP